MSIEVIIGCMFSGKSTELLRRIRRHTLASAKCLLIKASIDKRYTGSNNAIVTHDQDKEKAISICNILELKPEMWKQYDVIGCDEGQFLGANIAKVCTDMANSGKTVIITMLDSDYKQKPFPNMAELVAISDKITKLSAICFRCKKNDAIFSNRLASASFSGKSDFVVGGSDKYESLCRTCLYSYI